MKIQCDVCNKEEASLFCAADEAALCLSCDLRVHRANKLAEKHHRFSLLHPSSSQPPPRCDVCQERRAFLFCQEDRAILCRDCDLPIHTANDHTRKHNRFLLTGVKLSSCCLPPNTSREEKVVENSGKGTPETAVSGEKEVVSSSISDYLMKTLPGWHVEDFLDSSASESSKTQMDEMLLPFLEADLETNTGFVSENLLLWVPKVPQMCAHPTVDAGVGFKDCADQKVVRRWRDDTFAVPQISPPAKRAKTPLWHC